MILDAFVRPWSGTAFRHIPANSPYPVLDVRFAGRAAQSRWNYPGEPTLYLAGDRGVAIAEFARHLEEERSAELRRGAVERALFRLEVAVDALLDLRDPGLHRALSLDNVPYCFLDKAIARAVAQYLRRTTPTHALLVPSMAFLDAADRWVLVLFLEKLPPDPQRFITATPAGRFCAAEEV